MAAAITQKLQPDEIDAISFEIARMESVSPAVVDAVLEEWMTRIMVADSLAQGGSEAAREILDKAFGPRKAAQILEREAQNAIMRLTAMLTPALTIIMGLLIGGLVVSVMTALLSINEIAVQ